MSKIAVRIHAVRPEYIPHYATGGSAGADVRVARSTTIEPHSIALVPLGFVLEFPQIYVAKLYIRSSIARKGVCLANSVGIIDSDFRGQVCALVHNTNRHEVHLIEGDRLAQIAFEPVMQADFQRVETLEQLTETSRGTGGFGSTGSN